MASELFVRKLEDETEVAASFAVMVELRRDLTQEQFTMRVREQALEGYELAGGFVDGRLVTLAGYRISTTMVRGRHLFVDDLVTAQAEQGKGWGRQMIAWLAREAVARGVEKVYLDSRASARGFYEKVGFTMHTAIPCFADAKSLVGE